MNLDALRTLDPATPMTAAERERAMSALDRIVAEPYRTGRAVRRRLVAVAAAAVAVAALVVPGTLDDRRAYASWTAVPTPLSVAELALIEPECRAGLGRDGGMDLDRARLALAERRGEYVALLYRIEDPETSGECLARNVPGSDDVDDAKWGVGGSSGPARTAPARGYTQGAIADFRDATITDGAVGADVTAVTIHARRLTVQATVAGGRYVAWWPGPAFDRDDMTMFVTYDLTLRDGTVIRDAAPAMP